MSSEHKMDSQILIYQSTEGNIKVDVHLEDETVWLTQAQMSVSFDKSKKTISEHIGNIFKEGELLEDSVVRKFRTTAADGKEYQLAPLPLIIKKSPRDRGLFLYRHLFCVMRFNMHFNTLFCFYNHVHQHINGKFFDFPIHQITYTWL